MSALPVLAGYRMQSLLARGHGTVVYLATDAEHGDPVAIKVAREAQALGLRHEYESASGLAHANVIRVRGHGVQGDTAYLAMEHAAQGSLQRRAGRLAHAEVLAALRQAASALAFIHRRGWVHRDVKPANLLLRQDGSLALADFGSACRVGTVPPARDSLVGTPQYAAPEQTRGAPAAPPADVYGLGVVLHELLCGHVPFPGQTPAELLAQHLVAPVPRLPQAHADWQPLLDAMLHKEPQARPADGEALLAALAQGPHLPSQPSCHGGTGNRAAS